MHAKTIVVDRRLAWIGSFNLDPRSSRLNTEMAVLLESAPLAADLARRMELDMTPERSWRVMIIPGTRQVRWGGYRDGKPVTLHREPDAGWLLRTWARHRTSYPAIERFCNAMIVKFSTRHGQITMLGEPALRLLVLGGHSGTVPGAILAAELPAFLAQLRARLAGPVTRSRLPPRRATTRP